MIRRFLTRAGAIAACSCLLWGGNSLFGAANAAASPAGTPAPLMIGAPAPAMVPSVGVEYGQGFGAIGPVAASTNVLAAGGSTVATNTADGVATIPLPPSAYPGMVGLATAALSVWRYRRRRR
jgi:hypothetical protein